MSSSGTPQADIAGMLSRSDELFEELCHPFDVVQEVPIPDRGKAVFALCFVSYEHALSLRSLISKGYMTSALSLMRLQYEALTRAMWSMYVAPDSAIEKLTASLTLENEQTAKSLPSLNQMLEQMRSGVGTKLPQAAFEMLDGFRRASWASLNSFVHGGIHAVRRGVDGYPAYLVLDVLRSSNALLTMAGMTMAILVGDDPLVHRVSSIQREFADCLPPLVYPS